LTVALGHILSSIGVLLLASIVSPGEEAADQLVEHADGGIGQRGPERHELSDDRAPSAIGVEVGHEPGRSDVALPDDLVPTLGMHPGLSMGIDGYGAHKGQAIQKTNQIIGARCIRR
jgi:hypothetical protein